jgi:hypothetical protein
LLSGFGSGRSSRAIKRLSMWHMLSYARHTDDIASQIDSSHCPSSCSFLNFRYNHSIVTRNAWVGDSDLRKLIFFLNIQLH